MDNIITTITFEHVKGIDLHELLCKALHEQERDAIQTLTDSVADIATKEDITRTMSTDQFIALANMVDGFVEVNDPDLTTLEHLLGHIFTNHVQFKKD